MKKLFLSGFILSLIFSLSACGQKTTTNLTPIEDECTDICDYVGTTCPGLMPIAECQDQCLACPENIRKEIKETADCALIEQKLSQCKNITPTVSTTGNNCDAACNNYNQQCLTHVPNADQNLFQQGYDSCMELCQDWDDQKIECLAAATNCPDMTIICGL